MQVSVDFDLHLASSLYVVEPRAEDMQCRLLPPKWRSIDPHRPQSATLQAPGAATRQPHSTESVIIMNTLIMNPSPIALLLSSGLTSLSVSLDSSSCLFTSSNCPQHWCEAALGGHCLTLE